MADYVLGWYIVRVEVSGVKFPKHTGKREREGSAASEGAFSAEREGREKEQ